MFTDWFDRLPDPAARALRTFAQVALAEVIVTVVDHGTVLLSSSQWVDTLDGGAVAGLAGLLALGWNSAEDRGLVAAPGKGTPLDRPR